MDNGWAAATMVMLRPASCSTLCPPPALACSIVVTWTSSPAVTGTRMSTTAGQQQRQQEQAQEQEVGMAQGQKAAHQVQRLGQTRQPHLEAWRQLQQQKQHWQQHEQPGHSC